MCKRLGLTPVAVKYVPYQEIITHIWTWMSERHGANLSRLHVKAEGFVPSAWGQLANHFGNLTELSCSIQSNFAVASLVASLPRLRRLRTLQIQIGHARCFVGLLLAVGESPSIERLTLVNYRFQHEELLFCPSLNHVKLLHIRRSTLSADALVLWPRVFPNVSDLVMDNVSVPNTSRVGFTTWLSHLSFFNFIEEFDTGSFHYLLLGAASRKIIWPRLMHFRFTLKRMTLQTWTSFAKLVPWLPNLQVLGVRITDQSQEARIFFEHVVKLPRLTRLEVDIKGSVDVILQAMANLCFPVTTDLTIRGMSFGVVESLTPSTVSGLLVASPLWVLVAQAFPVLVTLTLNMPPCTQEELKKFLFIVRGIPSLKRITILLDQGRHWTFPRSRPLALFE